MSVIGSIWYLTGGSLSRSAEIRAHEPADGMNNEDDFLGACLSSWSQVARGG